jgi:hypothetical protein
MAISQANARNEVLAGLSNNNNIMMWDKASISTQVVGFHSSLWRATGVPGQGAIPGAAAYCTKALTGAVTFDNQTNPVTSYISKHDLNCSNANTNFAVYDRLAHMGGLNGTLLTAQTVGIDLTTINAGGAVPAARRGAADYGDVEWFLEWYTTTGATASNATVAVTYDDGSTGNLAVIAVGSSIAASQKRRLVSAVAGRSIRGVVSVTLSASTGTAGSFGVTAAVKKTEMSNPIASKTEIYDWAQLGNPEVPNDACLYGVMIATATTTGTIRGIGKIIHA